MCSSPTCDRAAPLEASVAARGGAFVISTLDTRPDEPPTSEATDPVDAIWLCAECLVAGATRTSAELQHWKATHEAAIADAGLVAPLAVEWATRESLRLPLEPDVADEPSELRQHVATLVSQARRPLFGLRLRVQFPELVIGVMVRAPAGLLVTAEPETTRAPRLPGAPVAWARHRLPNVVLTADRIFPEQRIEAELTCVPDPASPPWEERAGADRALDRFLTEGTFLVPWREQADVPRELFAGIGYDPATRRVTGGPVATHRAEHAARRFFV